MRQQHAHLWIITLTVGLALLTAGDGAPAADVAAASVPAHQIAIGPGYTDVSPKQLVRTRGDRLYVVAATCGAYPDCSADGAANALRVYGADQTGLPTTFSRLDVANEPRAVVTVAVAIDSADTLHVAWVERAGGLAAALKYRTFSTVTDTWLGAAQTIDDALAYDDVGQGEQGCALALDTAGSPHVVYLKGALPARRVYYRNRAEGSWSAAVQVDDGVAYVGNQKAWHANLAFDTGGRVVVAWLRGAFNGGNDGTIFARVREMGGPWGATTTVSGTDEARVTIDQSTSLLVTADNRYHLVYLSQPADYIRYAYSDDRGTTWARNDPGGGGQATHNPSLGPDGAGGLRLYGHGAPPLDNPDGHGDNIYYFAGPGGGAAWGAWTLYATGAFDSSVNTRWAQNHFYHPEWLDVAYWADPYPNLLYVGVDPAPAMPPPSTSPTATPAPSATPTTPPTYPEPPSIGATTWYFAEGYTGPGFDQYLAILNPNPADAQVVITYYLGAGQPPVTRPLTAPANSRTTLAIHDSAQIGRGQEVSAKVESTNGVGIIAERPMYFTYGGTITGGHVVLGATAPATSWSFAEGYTGPGFDQYLTIQNPGAAGTATITYYVEGSSSPVVRAVNLAANSRTTIPVYVPFDATTNPGGLGRLNVGHSTKIEASVPVVAERPMYFTYGGSITGGHVVLGASAPATSWSFAEGYTGPGFDQYLTIQNPTAQEGTATITYLLEGQALAVRTVLLPAASRTTVQVHAPASAANPGGYGRTAPGQGIATQVETSVPTVVERPMYFSYSSPGTGLVTGGHVALGAAGPRSTWYFAEGYTGAGFDTYLTIQNPNATEVAVTITYYVGGTTQPPREITVPANARRTVQVHELGEGVGRGLDVSARVATSHPGGIVVERPMYFRYAGTIDGGHTVVGYTP